jgi:DNA replication licensing factor MCM4
MLNDPVLCCIFWPTEDMPAGQTPHTVVAFAHNDLVDAVQPGDRVAITGIYRATPLRSNPRQRNVLSVYKTHIDVVHYRKLDARRLHEAGGDERSVLSSESDIVTRITLQFS